MPKENIPSWKCIHYDDVSEDLFKDNVDSVHLCVHFNSIPTCDYSKQPLMEPCLSHDGGIYEKQQLQRLLSTGQVSPKTGGLFPSNRQYSVRISSKYSLQSKLLPNKRFNCEQGIVGVFAIKDSLDQDTAVLMIEKQVRHIDKKNHECYWYGSIDSYQLCNRGNGGYFRRFNRAEIEKTAITGLDYAKLTQVNVLKRYGITLNQLVARAFVCDIADIEQLEQQIIKDRCAIENAQIYYSDYANKFFFNIFCSGKNFYTAASWVALVLKNSGVLSTLNFDPRYPILTTYSTTSRFWKLRASEVLPQPQEADVLENNALESVASV